MSIHKYEPCGECNFDHDIDYSEAAKWHTAHPCSYCVYTEAKGHESSCCTRRTFSGVFRINPALIIKKEA